MTESLANWTEVITTTKWIDAALRCAQFLRECRLRWKNEQFELIQNGEYGECIELCEQRHTGSEKIEHRRASEHSPFSSSRNTHFRTASAKFNPFYLLIFKWKFTISFQKIHARGAVTSAVTYIATASNDDYDHFAALFIDRNRDSCIHYCIQVSPFFCVYPASLFRLVHPPFVRSSSWSTFELNACLFSCFCKMSVRRRSHVFCWLPRVKWKCGTHFSVVAHCRVQNIKVKCKSFAAWKTKQSDSDKTSKKLRRGRRRRRGKNCATQQNTRTRRYSARHRTQKGERLCDVCERGCGERKKKKKNREEKSAWQPAMCNAMRCMGAAHTHTPFPPSEYVRLIFARNKAYKMFFTQFAKMRFSNIVIVLSIFTFFAVSSILCWCCCRRRRHSAPHTYTLQCIRSSHSANCNNSLLL